MASSNKKQNKVAILTSGGLAPCLSSAVGYLIESYTRKSPETPIICYLNGYRGLLLGNSVSVTDTIRKQAPKLQHLGGSPIGNSRVRLKNAKDCVDRGLVKPGESPERVAALQLIKDGITILHTIGGDDTNMSAGDLSAYLRANFNDYKLSVIGLPKTIDNDVWPVSQTLGAQTAAEQGAIFFRNVVAEFSANPKTLIVHEVMGRNSGWLTAKTAQVYSATNSHEFPSLVTLGKTAVHGVYIPEATFDLQEESARLKSVMDKVGCVNVFLSEGSCSEVILKEKESKGEEIQRDAFGHIKLDTLNPGKWFAHEMAGRIGAEKILVQKSGYFCRSAPANDFDRRLVRACSEKAVEFAFAGMTGLSGPDEEDNGQIRCISYSRVSGGKPFDVGAGWFRVLMEEIGQKIIPLNREKNKQFFTYVPSTRTPAEAPALKFSRDQKASHLVSISTVSLLPVSSEEADSIERLASETQRADGLPDVIFALMAGLKNVAEALRDVDCADGSASFTAIADSLFERSLRAVRSVSAVAALSQQKPLLAKEGLQRGHSVVLDSVDGSSNLDANVSVGTIFGVFADSEERKPGGKNFLRKGEEMVASGYCLYGSATILMLTFGQGVYGFTMDPKNKSFVLSHEKVKIPPSGPFYSANEGYLNEFSNPLKEFLYECKSQKMSLRYVGTLVADIHRTMLYGGVFLYPPTEKYPAGKLKLLSEASPLAFLLEQAGGKAVSVADGKRILSIEASRMDETVTLAAGSQEHISALMRKLGFKK